MYIVYICISDRIRNMYPHQTGIYINASTKVFGADFINLHVLRM